MAKKTASKKASGREKVAAKLKVAVEIIPASGSSETRTIEVATGASLQDALNKAKVTFKASNVFLNDKPVGKDALKTTTITTNAAVRVMERPAGS